MKKSYCVFMKKNTVFSFLWDALFKSLKVAPIFNLRITLCTKIGPSRWKGSLLYGRSRERHFPPSLPRDRHLKLTTLWRHVQRYCIQFLTFVSRVFSNEHNWTSSHILWESMRAYKSYKFGYFDSIKQWIVFNIAKQLAGSEETKVSFVNDWNIRNKIL